MAGESEDLGSGEVNLKVGAGLGPAAGGGVGS